EKDKDDLKNVYQTQTLFKFPGGLKDFSHGYYNGAILDKVEQLIGINEIYTIGLRRKNKLFSAIHIITFGDGSLENKELLEAFLNQSSAALRRKMLEKENVQLADIVRQSDDAIIQTDKQFQITYMNAKSEELWGYSFDDVKGKSPGIFNASDKKNQYQNEIYTTVENGETFFGDCLNKRKNGSLFWCQMKISPMYDEEQNITGYMSFARDITDKKNAEKKN
ncbi:MAG: PAS domain S-box protein, partial [Candidatus Thermoplasmatota archaeon]|nr:PAS domain S-box protein [Candidatus Thermoplasmatota archaeon]